MPHAVTNRCPRCHTRSTWHCPGRPWHGREGTSMDGESGCSAGCDERPDELCPECGDSDDENDDD